MPNPLDSDFKIEPMNAPLMNGAQGPDAALYVRFYSSPQLNKAMTEKEGRPIYEDRDFVEIRRPGSPHPLFEGEAREKDKVRFPAQWNAYKNKGDQNVVGTRIEFWPQVNTVQVATLKYLNIFTVEQLAAADDLAIQKIGMGGRELHEKAKVYLKLASDTGIPQKLAAENVKLKDELNELRKEMRELSAQLKGK